MKTRLRTRIAGVACVLITLLYAVPVQAQVTPPSRGGTGTSTHPTYGQVLIGQQNGTYGPVATSTLGISGFSTSSADNWITTKTTSMLAEGSNLYYTLARVQAALIGGYSAIFGNATSTNLAVTGSFNLLGSVITNVSTWFSGLFDTNFAAKLLTNLTFSGNVTVTGTSTLATTTATLIDKAGQVYNVKAYGAVGDGTTNDTTAVTSAVTALNANGGGVLLFPQGGNYVLTPSIQISSNTHIINQGTITLATGYVNTTTVFKGIFRLGGTGGTDIVDNVEIEGGRVVGDAFSSPYVDASPTFNANNHKYVGYVHSVSTHRNVRIHGIQMTNIGTPVTLEKLAGVNGTPSSNVHVYDLSYDQVWVGVQYYANGYVYEDSSIHDITANFCYDDCVAVVGGPGGVPGAPGIARGIQVYNIRGQKTGQTGAFVKLDATLGYLYDIQVTNVVASTTGVNEYLVGIIGANGANNKKFNLSNLQTVGTWTYGVYAQTNGRFLNISNFSFEGINGIHLQGNQTPDHYQSVLISDGQIQSRNAALADLIEGYGISYSAGNAAQGFQNVRVRDVDIYNKLAPIYEGSAVAPGTGVQGTYKNFGYDVDFRDSPLASSTFSAASSSLRYSNNGEYKAQSPIFILASSTSGLPSLFSIASSTGSLLSTLFSVSNSGSTTIANGLNLTAGCFALSGTCFTAASYIWSAVQRFNSGFLSLASTTIGDGTLAEGLTVSGNSTTTGNAFISALSYTPANAPLTIAGTAQTAGPSVSDVLILDRPFNSGVFRGRRASLKVGASDGVSAGPTRLDFALSATGVTSLTDTTLPANTILTLLSSGLSGYGTTSPYAQLSLGGGNLVLGAASAGGTPGDLYLPKLGTAAGSFLAVDPTGKVIATTTPAGGSGVTAVTGTYPVASSGGPTPAISLAVATSSVSLGLGLSGALNELGAGNSLSVATSSLFTGTQGQVAYFSGSNSLTGTSALIIGLNGKIGIGTTTPYSNLDLYEQNGTGYSPYMRLGGNDVGDTDYYFGRVSNNDSANNDYLGWGTSTTTSALMALSSTGSLGIGSTTPFAKLSLVGNQLIDSNSATAFGITSLGTTTTALNVDNSLPGTGISITSTAPVAGGAVTIAATGAQSAVGLTVSSKSTGTLTLQAPGTGSVFIQSNAGSNAPRFAVSSTGYTFVRGTASGASTVRFSYTNAADTALIASTEAPEIYYNLGNAVRTHASGAIATQRDFRTSGTTHTFSAGTSAANSLITNLAAFAVDYPQIGAIGGATNLAAIYVPTIALNASTTNAFGLSVAAPTGATTNGAGTTTGKWIMNALTSSATGNAVCISSTNEILNAGGASCTPSSIRFKENLEDMKPALEKLMQFHVVTYDYKEGVVDENERASMGLIAEEAAQVYPALADYGADGEIFSIHWERLYAPIIKSIQELAANDNEQQAQIDELRAEIEALEASKGVTYSCLMR